MPKFGNLGLSRSELLMGVVEASLKGHSIIFRCASGQFAMEYVWGQIVGKLLERVRPFLGNVYGQFMEDVWPKAPGNYAASI